jgi:hypothetical protein
VEVRSLARARRVRRKNLPRIATLQRRIEASKSVEISPANLRRCARRHPRGKPRRFVRLSRLAKPRRFGNLRLLGNPRRFVRLSRLARPRRLARLSRLAKPRRFVRLSRLAKPRRFGNRRRLARPRPRVKLSRLANLRRRLAKPHQLSSAVNRSKLSNRDPRRRRDRSLAKLRVPRSARNMQRSIPEEHEHH